MKLSKLRSFAFRYLLLARRPMTLGVRAIMQNEAREILLVRHTYTKGWYLPGGGVEAAQTLDEALAMELREEVNVTRYSGAKFLGMFHNRDYSVRDHVGLYHCRDWEQDGPVVPNHEIAQAGLFSIDDLPDDMNGGSRRRVMEVFFGQPVSPYW